MLRKLIAALLLIFMLIPAVSCAPVTPQQSTGTDTPPTEEITQDSAPETQETAKPENKNDAITLYKDGKWQYRIVTRTVRSSDEVDFSFALTKVMSELTGSAPHSANDTAQKDESVCEIIIGSTKHPAMQALYSSLGYGNACIKIEGNKIYIAAYSQKGWEELQKFITKQLKAFCKNGEITLKASDLEKIITVNDTLNLIPVANSGSFSSLNDCGNGQTLIIVENSGKNGFESYLSLLKDHTCVSSTSEAGNEFATFDFGDHLLNVGYSKHDSGLRIILNKNTEPTELFSKPESVKKVCEPMLIMHGLAWKQAGYTYYTYGMCYLIRLSDGRFIIIDGGFNRKKDADDLYALLKKYTVSGTPTIAMWIITHAHIDHHGTFAMQFLSNYRNSVTVENVIFNPPGGDILTDPENESVSGLLNGQIVVANATKAYKAELIRPHVGDRYYVGDAVIDIVYTVDYQYPKTFNYYNTCSMMLSITIAGQRIMITGDASNEAFGKAVAMFGSALKSDIVQVAHHGGTSGVSATTAQNMSEGYTLMSPSIVLWPAADEGYESSSKSAFNKVLLALPTIKEVVVAHDRDFAVTLPYKK